MAEITKIIPLVITLILAIAGSYITMRIAIAELRRDVVYLKEKIDGEITSTKEREIDHENNMKEVRDDVKAIFSALTKIQVDFAKSQGKSEGRDEVLNVIKNAVQTIAKRNN